MTPKEKAEDLIEKFWNDAECSIDRSMSARSCAKICVQEIISIEGYNDGPPGSSYYNPGKYFWKQVLIEIDKL